MADKEDVEVGKQEAAAGLQPNLLLKRRRNRRYRCPLPEQFRRIERGSVLDERVNPAFDGALSRSI